MNSPSSFSRRGFLGNLFGSLAIATSAGSLLTASTPDSVKPARSDRKRLLRMAHLTDSHVLPSMDADKGLALAITKAQDAKPDFIFFGGDLVMDSLKHSKDEVHAQWKVWHDVTKATLKTEAVYAIGNHDVWGWALPPKERLAVSADPLFGKGFVLDQLGLKERYRSFDRNGWHFVILDSVYPDFTNEHGYNARIDDTQFEWLAADLAATPAGTPVCILSHIPILAACTYLDGESEKEGSWHVPGAWMHIDARRLKDLFVAHPNVKACISGHVHLVEDLRYLGVRYLCNGAVCGGWWKGPYQEFGPAFALVDFYDDGSVENELVYYKA